MDQQQSESAILKEQEERIRQAKELEIDRKEFSQMIQKQDVQQPNR